MTKIEWTDATWNPVTGCTKVSPGCDHCYAERWTERFKGKGSFTEVTLHPERLARPLKWRKPLRVFVNSMSDLFHDEVPDEYIARVFAVMAATPQHTYQILTKRHARMRSLLSAPWFPELVTTWAWRDGVRPLRGQMVEMPAPNVWLGVSVEDRRWADIRIPALLDTPAAVRFLSCEPLLGPVDLGAALLRPYERQQGGYWEYGHGEDVYGNGREWVPATGIDWVIVGGESGPGARPMHPDWPRSLRDQCQAARVPFFFKQWGEWAPDELRFTAGVGPGATRYYFPDDSFMHHLGKKRAGRELDGRTWDEFPQPSQLADHRWDIRPVHRCPQCEEDRPGWLSDEGRTWRCLSCGQTVVGAAAPSDGDAA